MNKAIITKVGIKNELKKMCLLNVIKFGLLVLICLSYLVLYILNPQLSIYKPNSLVLLLSLLYLYIIIMSAINLFVIFKSYSLIINDKIDIVSDELVDKNEKTQLSRYRGKHYTYTFIFEKSGEYKLKKHILNISNPYNMDNDELYDRSQIYDKFYVVRVGKQNMLVYNKNFFELKLS